MFNTILDQLFILLFACFCQINASFHWYFTMRKRSILLEPANQDSGETTRIVQVKSINMSNLCLYRMETKLIEENIGIMQKIGKKSLIILRKLPPFCTKNIVLKIMSISASYPMICNKKIAIYTHSWRSMQSSVCIH